MLTDALDPRINAFRPDLADFALANQVKAEKYIEPMMRQSVRGVLPLMEKPTHDCQQVSQIRYGEFVDIFEMRDDGFAWVQNRTDRYVGYMPIVPDGLSEEIADLSYRIPVLRTFVYADASIKSPVIDELTLGSYVRPVGENGDLVELASGGFVFAKHVVPSDEALTPDYTFAAGRLLNVSYLWGGRTPMGIDCSGLVQLALSLAGIDVPRDSDQQRAAFGQQLPEHWRDMAWKRGDVVFLKGHVGIMANHDHLIHASGESMQVVVQPLVEVVTDRNTEIIAFGRF